MDDNGDTKDDVRVPDGEIGDKINKLFVVDEKDTSKFLYTFASTRMSALFELIGINPRPLQTLLFSPPWVRRPLLMPRKPPRALVKMGENCFLSAPP